VKTKTIILLILAALGIVLLVQNTQVVTYRLFFWKIAMSQVILVPFIFIAGFITAIMVTRFEWRRKKPGPPAAHIPPQQLPPRT